jgi:hypothetical protein
MGGTNERSDEGFVYEDPRAAFASSHGNDYEAYQRARTVGRHKDRNHKRAKAARSTRGNRYTGERTPAGERTEATTRAKKNTAERTNATKNTTERTEED